MVFGSTRAIKVSAALHNEICRCGFWTLFDCNLDALGKGFWIPCLKGHGGRAKVSERKKSNQGSIKVVNTRFAQHLRGQDD